MNDPAPSVIEQVRQRVHEDEGQHVGFFNDAHIRSEFQPIYSLVHSRLVGAEGLMRCRDQAGQAISPLVMLNHTRLNEKDAVQLDRLCRYLHIRNFITHVEDAHWVFLNVSAQTIIAGRNYGSYFSELLREVNFPPHRVVVEILEDNIHDELKLSRAVDYYRDLGCVIAIDDFGAGHSNFNRVWEIRPDIVKLDRSLVVRASQDSRTRRALPNLVKLLHESGCLVLMEGVELESEAVVAMGAGVDMVQGYYFARPSLKALPPAPIMATISQVHERFIDSLRQASTLAGNTLKSSVELFREAIAAFKQGGNFESAVSTLTASSAVIRCYALDKDGRQLNGSVLSEQAKHGFDQRFAILTDGAGADWSTRHYFRSAMTHPEQIQISNPYLSIADARMCVTFSVAVAVGANTRVVCCDIEWQEQV